MLPEVQQPAVSQENASSYIPPPNLDHQLDQPPQQQQTFNSNYFFQNYANIVPGQYVPDHGMYQMQAFAPPPPPYYNITNMGVSNVPQTQPEPVVQESDLNVLKIESSPSPVRASNEKPTNSLSAILKSKVCAICGDRPTGKHYGAYACDGCKGFFRRNIRNNTRNQCRFNQDCVVGKSSRNQCRACRMRKCFDAGMRRESVQNERGPISQPNRQKPTQDGKSSSLILVSLSKAEISAREIEDQPNLVTDFELNIESKQIANLKDISISLEQHSPALVKWAGLIPIMSQLSRNDQFALFKANLIEKWILDLVIRSLPLNDVLLLSNDLIIPKNSNASTEPHEITRIYSRIFNELVTTMKELSLDDNELACLKAITFFNPSVAGLDNLTKVKQLRSQVHECLEDYINPKGRFGEILLILPTLQSIITELLVQMRALPKLEIPVPQQQPEMVQINNEILKVEENINKSIS